MDVLDIFTKISLIILTIALVILLVKHVSPLLTFEEFKDIITFFFGYWCGKNLNNE